MLEHPDEHHPLHEAARRIPRPDPEFIEELAAHAGVREPEPFARQWHILMKGSIVAAGEGDRDAALRAKAIGEPLLQRAIG